MYISFSDYSYESFIVPFLLLGTTLILIFLMLKGFVKKYPPYIEKKDKSSDTLIVHSPLVGRHGFFGYNAHSFIRRKNGKYRIKLSKLDLILTLLSILGFLALYIYIAYIMIYVGLLILDFIFILLWILISLFFAELFVWLHFSKFVSLIYFRKLLKGLK